MTKFEVPNREDVSVNNKAIFDNLNKNIGFVPNLYALMAYSDNALGSYLQFQGSKTSFSNKEKEAINLIVSQENGCNYCQAAHTTIGKMNGFTEEQTIEIRKGYATWDEQLDALVKLTQDITQNRGRVKNDNVEAFFNASYTKESLVDLTLIIGGKTVMNYLHNLTNIAIDFPIAKIL
jgi:AhpD family alkylhydroperoxidase